MDYVKPIGRYGSDDYKKLEYLRAELAAANARIKTLETGLLKGTREINKFYDQLAATQLANKRLVEALEDVKYHADPYEYPLIGKVDILTVRRGQLLTILDVVTHALTTPIDTAALDAYVEAHK